MAHSKTITFRTVLSKVELDLESGKLISKAGTRRIRKGCVQVLAHLLEHANQTVAKTDLLQEFWREPVGGEDSLAHVISDIRKALGDDGMRQQVIVTVPGVGYRLETLPARTAIAGWKVAAGFILFMSILVTVGLTEGGSARLAKGNVAQQDSSRSAERTSQQLASQKREARQQARRYMHEALAILGEATAHSAAQASALFQRSVEVDPEFALGWAWLSIANSQYISYHKSPEERGDISKSAAQKAMDIAPGLPEAWTALALTSEREAALPMHRRAIELGPRNAGAYYFAGLHVRVIEPLLGAVWLRKAYELDPNNLHALIHVAFSYEIAGDQPSAREVWKDVAARVEERLKHDPLSPGLLMKAAVALQKTDRMKEARDYAERVLEQRPNDPQALYSLGGVLALDKQDDVAIKMIDKAVKSGFHNIEVLRCMPEFERIRDNSRFQEALAQVDFL